MKRISQTLANSILLWFGDTGVLFLRVFAGAFMLSHGIAKIVNFSAYYDTFPDVIGIGSHFSFLLILLAETVGSLFVILGFLTRWASLALVFGMLVAAFTGRPPFAFATAELPLLYSVVFASILLHGGGKYSLDSLIWGRVMGNID